MLHRSHYEISNTGSDLSGPSQADRTLLLPGPPEGFTRLQEVATHANPAAATPSHFLIGANAQPSPESVLLKALSAPVGKSARCSVSVAPAASHSAQPRTRGRVDMLVVTLSLQCHCHSIQFTSHCMQSLSRYRHACCHIRCTTMSPLSHCHVHPTQVYTYLSCHSDSSSNSNDCLGGLPHFVLEAHVETT